MLSLLLAGCAASPLTDPEAYLRATEADWRHLEPLLVRDARRIAEEGNRTVREKFEGRVKVSYDVAEGSSVFENEVEREIVVDLRCVETVKAYEFRKILRADRTASILFPFEAELEYKVETRVRDSGPTRKKFRHKGHFPIIHHGGGFSPLVEGLALPPYPVGLKSEPEALVRAAGEVKETCLRKPPEASTEYPKVVLRFDLRDRTWR